MARLKSVKELNNYRELLQASLDPNKIRIVVCSGTGCNSFGSKDIGVAFEQAIEYQRLKDKIEVLKTGCHGFCQVGPIVVILPKGIFYQGVVLEDVDEIILSVIDNGEIIDRLLYQDMITGKKIIFEQEVPFYAKQKRIVLSDNNRIDPTQINHYIELGGYSALSKVFISMSPEDVIEEVKRSGLRGRGGSGFLTGLKWDICKQAKEEQKYVICNADFTDKSILEGNPHKVIEGMIIAAYAIGSNHGFIYARTALGLKHSQIAIEQAKEMGLLGDNILGTGIGFNIRIKQGSGAFIGGEETVLIASIEGKRGASRPRPPYPVQSGLFGKPTNINNVETYANIPHIILNGSEDYAKIGTEKSKGTKIFTLTGKINNSGLIEVPLGTTLREIIFDIGGGIPKGRRFKAAQLGGPSGGCLTNKHLDLPIDYETLLEAGMIIGSGGGVTVMGESDCIVKIARFGLEFLQSESCGKCTPCRIGTKRMLEIITRITQGDGQEGDIDTLLKIGRIIKDSSLCGLGQTAPNFVLSTIEYFRDEYESHIKEKKCPAYGCDNLYTAPCSDTCPVGIEVHNYVALIANEQFKEALRLIRERNPFPGICGRVCHHPCELKCRRMDVDEPIAIRSLKRFVFDYESMSEPAKHKIRVKSSRIEKIAIIGAGPSGLSCAYELGKKGYCVTIFEALEVPGGMLAVGIPNYRLPKDVLNLEIDNIIHLGVDIKTNIEVGKDISFDDILRDYKAVFIGIGTSSSKRMLIEGEETNGVVPALEFLRKVNLNKPIELGERVAVIGGGNAAIDAARASLRLGAKEVTIVYRRSRNEMPAIPIEIEDAEHEGIKIKILTAPKRILSEDGRVKGIECFKMGLSESFDKSGRRISNPIENSEFVLDVDMVISAIGQDVKADFLKDKIEFTRQGTIKTTNRYQTTNITGVFAGGDASTGANTVIEAIAAGNRAAIAIDEYLNNNKQGRKKAITRKPYLLELADEEAMSRKRHIMPTLEIEKRIKGFEEVELGFTCEMAVNEAKRCLKCHVKG